jgi:hypothetical protein
MARQSLGELRAAGLFDETKPRARDEAEAVLRTVQDDTRRRQARLQPDEESQALYECERQLIAASNRAPRSDALNLAARIVQATRLALRRGDVDSLRAWATGRINKDSPAPTAYLEQRPASVDEGVPQSLPPMARLDRPAAAKQLLTLAHVLIEQHKDPDRDGWRTEDAPDRIGHDMALGVICWFPVVASATG